MITWWQVFIVFWIVGLSSRLDEKLLQQGSDFRRGMGLFLRFLVVNAIWVGAWFLLDAWSGGIAW